MGRKADAIRLELVDAEAVTAAVGQARQRFGRLHLLVYAVGAKEEGLMVFAPIAWGLAGSMPDSVSV
ncbi:hypothetical protein D9M68_754260 [compost metagenome]